MASDLRHTESMAERWRAADGWTVEVVQLSCTPNHRDGMWLRVKQYSSWVADVRTVAELAQYVELADLEPELGARPLASLTHAFDAENRKLDGRRCFQRKTVCRSIPSSLGYRIRRLTIGQ